MYFLTCLDRGLYGKTMQNEMCRERKELILLIKCGDEDVFEGELRKKMGSRIIATRFRRTGYWEKSSVADSGELLTLLLQQQRS